MVDANRRETERFVRRPIRARHLYQEAFQFRPQFKLWFATNHKPRISGTDLAIWRRIRLIPFDETIPEHEVDPALEGKLLREAEGILSWAVNGAIAALRDGLNPPAEVTAATRAYRGGEDILGQFFTDCTVAEPRVQIAKRDLFELYKSWCDAQGERTISRRKLSAYVQEQGFDSYRGSKGVRFWIGLGRGDVSDAR